MGSHLFLIHGSGDIAIMRRLLKAISGTSVVLCVAKRFVCFVCVCVQSMHALFEITFFLTKNVDTFFLFLHENMLWVILEVLLKYTVYGFMEKQENNCLDTPSYLGPVVQSVVSLTSSLRVISLTVLADSIYNILIFFAEKM